MTEIRIESDAAGDKGKSFGGQKIKIVKKKRRSSSRSSSSRPITNITATLSTDGMTETIKSTTNGQTTTTITRKSSSGGKSSSRTINNNISLAEQRKITEELAKIDALEIKTLAQKKAALAKLEKEKGLQAEIKTKQGIIIQKGRFKLNKSAQNEIIRRTKVIKSEELRIKTRTELSNKLLAIDNNSNLNVFQKENAKRALFGIIQDKINVPVKLKLTINTLRLTSPEQNIINLATTGQSMTPTQQNKYVDIVNKNSDRLNKEQMTLLKNAPKDVALGLYEVGTDLVLFVRAVVTAPYNYGYSLGTRLNAGEKNPLEKDILALATGSYNTAKFILTEPKKALAIVGLAAKSSGKEYMKAFLNNPVKTVTKTVAYLAPGKILEGGKKIFQLLNKLNPKYVKEINGSFKIKTTPEETFKVKGKTKLLKERVKPLSFKRPFASISDLLNNRKPGQFKKFTKNPGLILKSQSVESGATPLSQAVKLAGQEITAVNTAASQLTSWLKRKQIIRKPVLGAGKSKQFPKGEIDFPTPVKNMLKKFDSGVKLTKKEFAWVNQWLQKNVAPNITLLERSLYADPASGFRKSMLGISKDAKTASLMDIVRGNFKLTSDKPQVLIFENAKVAKFPKALKSVENKLKKGTKLTVAETNRLIEWQVQSGSGKFKPIGSTIFKAGTELEVTLAPGDLVKRIKQVGFTYIKGKKVTFVTAEVYTPTKIIEKQMVKAKAGKLTDAQVSKLEKDLSNKLGRKINIETPNVRRRIPNSNTPVLRIKGRKILILSRTSIRKTPPRKTPPRKTPPRKTPPRKTPPRKTPPRKTPPRKTPPRKTPPRKTPPRKTPPRKTPPRKTPPRKTPPMRSPPRKTPPKKIVPRRLKSNIDWDKNPTKHKLGAITYKIKGKVKTIRTNLPYNKALTLARDTIDNSILASMTVKAYGKTRKKDSRTPKMNKFRVKRSKSTLVQELVEKRAHRLDTKGEKSEIKINKFIKNRIKRLL